MAKRDLKAELVAAYVEALGLTALPAAPDIWFSKAAHAELVAAQCGPQATRDDVVNAAAMLGARWRLMPEIEQAASNAVAEIIASVDHQRRKGGLAQVNAAYKIYRQHQVAKGEKVMPYAAHLATFTRSLVTLAAASARAN